MTNFLNLVLFIKDERLLKSLPVLSTGTALVYRSLRIAIGIIPLVVQCLDFTIFSRKSESSFRTVLLGSCCQAGVELPGWRSGPQKP